jgi:hypothetical protein
MRKVIGKRIYKVAIIKKRPHIVIGVKVLKYCSVLLETVLERSPLAIGRVLHEKVSEGAGRLKEKRVGVSLGNGKHVAIKLPMK